MDIILAVTSSHSLGALADPVSLVGKRDPYQAFLADLPYYVLVLGKRHPLLFFFCFDHGNRAARCFYKLKSSLGFSRDSSLHKEYQKKYLRPETLPPEFFEVLTRAIVLSIRVCEENRLADEKRQRHHFEKFTLPD